MSLGTGAQEQLVKFWQHCLNNLPREALAGKAEWAQTMQYELEKEAVGVTVL